MRALRPVPPRRRALRVAGLGVLSVLAGVVGGAVTGLLEVAPRPAPRAGEGA